MVDLRRVERESPGRIESELRGPRIVVRSLIDELPPEERTRRADQCNYLLVLAQGDSRYPAAVGAALAELRRTYAAALEKDQPDIDTAKLRGAIEACRVMEKTLTDPETLAETRKTMLGVDEAPEGDMAHAR